MNYQMMGGLYDNVGEPQKGKTYLYEALKIGDSINNPKIRALVLTGIAGKSSPDSALFLNNKALHYANEAGYRKFNSSILVSIAGVYF